MDTTETTDESEQIHSVDQILLKRHTAAEALEKFRLVPGAGNQESTACVMTAVSWMAGESWSDSPDCSHRLLRQMVIPVNDHPDTTPEDRARILRAGEVGLVDTWWITGEVIVGLLAGVDRELGRVDRLVALLDAVAGWKRADAKPRPVLRDAVLRGADLSGADLSGAVLRGADLSGADLSGAVLSGAVLSDADLSGADLSGAVLSDAVGSPVGAMPAGWVMSTVTGCWERG